MKLKPGLRLRSQVDATEVIVVRAPAEEVALTCGGHPMIGAGETPGSGLAPVSEVGESVQLGKRYVAEGRADFEVLASKAGTCGLAVDGVGAVVKDAKPLPASD